MKVILVLLASVSLYFLQRLVYSRFWRRNLTVNIILSDEKVMEGEEAELYETLENRKFLPLPIVRIKFMASKYFAFRDKENAQVTDQYYRNDILSVTKFQKLTRTLSFVCQHRGYYTINDMDVVCSDLFVTARSVANYPLDVHLFVYPKLVTSDLFKIQFRRMMGQILTKRYINEDPFEFRSIREYQPYDELKLINWKASARTDSLKVNVKDYTASQNVKILLNLESGSYRTSEDVQEESIRIAASFASAFIDQGVPVSVSTNAFDALTNEIVNIPMGCGSGHMDALLQSLACIDTGHWLEKFVPLVEKELPALTKYDYVVIVSSYQKEDLQNVISSLIHNQIDFSWIIPYNYINKVSVREELAPNVITWKI